MPTHRVVAGDDLRSLARRYYGDASQWRLITTANSGVLGDADEGLRPGLLLIIPISTDDATGWAEAAADPAGPDEPAPTWPVGPPDPRDVPVGSAPPVGTDTRPSTEITAAVDDLVSSRWRDRLPSPVFVVVMIIVLVIVSIVAFRVVRQGQLERELADHPAVVGFDARSKVVELDPDSTLPQLETIVSSLIELRPYNSGWVARIGRAELQASEHLTPSAAALLHATGGIDAAGVARIEIDPSSPGFAGLHGADVDVHAERTDTRAEAALATFSALTATGRPVTSAVALITVSAGGWNDSWMFLDPPLVEVDRMVAFLRVLDRLGGVGRVTMTTQRADIDLTAGSEGQGADLCRRARDQLSALPDLLFDLRIETPDRAWHC